MQGDCDAYRDKDKKGEQPDFQKVTIKTTKITEHFNSVQFCVVERRQNDNGQAQRYEQAIALERWRNEDRVGQQDIEREQDAKIQCDGDINKTQNRKYTCRNTRLAITRLSKISAAVQKNRVCDGIITHGSTFL